MLFWFFWLLWSGLAVSGQFSLLDDNQLCGDDTSVPAVCAFQDDSNHKFYSYSRPVARLSIEGSQIYCTGWLWGRSGHILTSSTCVDSATKLSELAIEFGAESYQCQDDTSIVCYGGLRFVGAAEYIYSNLALSYTLLQLNSSYSSDILKLYGYLQASAEKIKLGDPIYIPGHSSNGCKHIASTNPLNGKAAVTALNATTCGRQGFQYSTLVDAQYQGSPVLDQKNNKVLGLHICTDHGCVNAGVEISRIVDDLNQRGQLPPDAMASTNPSIPQEYTNPMLPPWNEFTFKLYPTFFSQIRRLSSRTTSLDHYYFKTNQSSFISVDFLANEYNDATNQPQDLFPDCQITTWAPVVVLFDADSNNTIQTTWLNPNRSSIAYSDPAFIARIPSGRYGIVVGSSYIATEDLKSDVNSYLWATWSSCGLPVTTSGAAVPYNLTVAGTSPIQWESHSVYTRRPKNQCTADFTEKSCTAFHA